MSAAPKLQRCSAQWELLDHMVRCYGSWLDFDPFTPHPRTIEAVVAKGYAFKESYIPGETPYALTITPLGRAAWMWGTAAVLRGGRR